MTFTATISLDHETFLEKPSASKQYKNYTNKFGQPKSETAVLGSRVGTNTQIVTPVSLAKYIAQGRTWSPFTFNTCPDWKRPRRIESLFKSCQVIAIDFDQGQDIEEIMGEADLIGGMQFNVIHHSFSSTPAYPKYRGIVFLEKEITDFLTIKRYTTALTYSFKKSDKQCVDAARLFFGSHPQSVMCVNTNEDAIMTIAHLEQIAKDCEVENLLTSSKLNVPKPEESEWGDSKTQKRILNDLPQRKRNYVKTKVLGILKQIKSFDGREGSRYECLWKSTSALARMPELVGSAVFQWTMEAVEQNSYFSGWDKNPEEVIMSAIQWSASHADDPIE